MVERMEHRGIESVVFYDLNQNPYEQGDFKEDKSSEVIKITNELLKIHNQGYSPPCNAYLRKFDLGRWLA